MAGGSIDSHSQTEVFAVIAIPRGLARSVRALARKCVSGRPRGPAPVVVFESRSGTLTVWVRTAEAGLAHSAPTRCPDGTIVVPMAVLEAVEGAGDEPVELVVGPDLRGEARWSDRGVPKSAPFEAIPSDSTHRPPDLPVDWHPIPGRFLTALHECGRTADRAAAGRFALTRVQVRGPAGQVIGTDGKSALVWGGFALPLDGDVLIPAVPVFGAKELAGEAVARVGQTPSELVVGVGPWRIHLPIDSAGRYPDVTGLLHPSGSSVAGIDARDAADLLAALPDLPGADDEHQPVTLDLAGVVVVRGRDTATEKTGEVRLVRSPATGPAVRLVIDRRVLARALALGCATIRIAAPGRPVMFEGDEKTLLVAALDPALASQPTESALATLPPAHSERRIAVRQDTNGHPPDAPADDAPDLLTAAEELRAAIADTLTKAGRLVVALKSRRREQKVLSQVWSNLKALNLGGGGGP